MGYPISSAATRGPLLPDKSRCPLPCFVNSQDELTGLSFCLLLIHLPRCPVSSPHMPLMPTDILPFFQGSPQMLTPLITCGWKWFLPPQTHLEVACLCQFPGATITMYPNWSVLNHRTWLSQSGGQMVQTKVWAGKHPLWRHQFWPLSQLLVVVVSGSVFPGLHSIPTHMSLPEAQSYWIKACRTPVWPHLITPPATTLFPNETTFWGAGGGFQHRKMPKMQLNHRTTITATM